MAEAVVEVTYSRTVLARSGRELIRLDCQRIALPPRLVAEARRELLCRDGGGDPDFRFGFLLGVERDIEAPAARRLARLLQRHLVAPVGRCRGGEFSLSFLKAAEGQAPRADEGPMFEGFHLDTHPAITGDDGPELLRVLVNLAPTPRAIRFVCTDRFELAAAGVRVARSDFQVVDPPREFDRSVVEIPPFQHQSVSYLTFWASLVPHVGIERPDGHFLASFEALAHR